MWALLVVLLIAGGLFATCKFQSKKKQRFLALSDFWVFSPLSEMPDQNKIIEQTVGANTFTQRGRNPIGHAEGLLLADVRLKISLILRSKNPSLFDLSKFYVEGDSTAFEEGLANAESIIRLQYISETPLKNKSHLQLLLHLAYAAASISGGHWIFDSVRGKLWTESELHALLKENFDVTDLETHVELDCADPQYNEYSLSGLSKIGVPDIITHSLPDDMVQLSKEILWEYAKKSWEIGMPYQEPISLYGDEFFFKRNRLTPTSESVSIFRKQLV